MITYRFATFLFTVSVIALYEIGLGTLVVGMCKLV